MILIALLLLLYLCMRYIYDNLSHESCQNNIVTKQLFDFNIINCKDHNYCTNNGNEAFLIVIINMIIIIMYKLLLIIIIIVLVPLVNIYQL